MLNVFFTVDVELWCDGWQGIDVKFSGAFRKYIYGPTSRGNYGLPYQLELLREYGLTGVFFVEPLFSLRFGIAPLAEIVGLIADAGQEVQLHLHTEWVDEARPPLLSTLRHKRQHLRYFPLNEQVILISEGLDLLAKAGAVEVDAFRAGSFAFNRDTLSALARNGIRFDSSYNASQFGSDSGLLPGQAVVEPVRCGEVYEYPMTVFGDGTSSLRHAQLTACSFRELEGLLWQALEVGRDSFVLLSHSFELLNVTKTRPDDVVVRRFQALCRFLDRYRDCFRVGGFTSLSPSSCVVQPEPLVSPLWRTGVRMAEQAYRRVYR